MRVVLEVIEGPRTGERLVFDQHRTFMVGRSPKVQFSLGEDDLYFSRFHFMVEINPPDCFLRDMSSTNGTYVNGQKVEHAYLNDGDRIAGGHTSFLVRIEQGADVGAVSPVPPAPAAKPVPARGGATLMRTMVFGPRQPPPPAAALACRYCGRECPDAKLREVSATGKVAYICGPCYEQHTTESSPVPGYTVLGDLGTGALGPVYQARRESDGAVVTLKVLARQLQANEEAARVFLRAMSLTAGLEHPHIVPVCEVGESAEALWLATKYVAAPDAAQLAEQAGGRLPLRDAVTIVCQVLRALHYAHDRNLVHRDVKPPNIMVEGQPGQYHAWLADFGLVRNLDDAGLSGITRDASAARGTIPFMPPEQVIDCRFVKPAGDIYAAGATLYWLLTGEFVHDFDVTDRDGAPKDPFVVVLDDPLIPIRRRLPEIPEPLAELIAWSLNEDPEDRPATAEELAAALEQAVS